MKAAVLTVSDGVDMGTREDASGDLLEELLRGEDHEVVRRVVPDERHARIEAIREHVRSHDVGAWLDVQLQDLDTWATRAAT